MLLLYLAGPLWKMGFILHTLNCWASLIQQRLKNKLHWANQSCFLFRMQRQSWPGHLSAFATVSHQHAQKTCFYLHHQACKTWDVGLEVPGLVACGHVKEAVNDETNMAVRKKHNVKLLKVQTFLYCNIKVLWPVRLFSRQTADMSKVACSSAELLPYQSVGKWESQAWQRLHWCCKVLKSGSVQIRQSVFVNTRRARWCWTQCQSGYFFQ